MARKSRAKTISPQLKSELTAEAKAERCDAAPVLDPEVRALATFLTAEGIDCGLHTNPELAKLILDFLARRKRH